MSFKEAMNIQRNYFKEYGQEISKRNLKLMETVCYVGILLYVAYYLLTFFFFTDKMISPVYALMVPLLGLFLLEIKNIMKKKDFSFKKTQMLTLLMLITITIYVIIMSTVPHPDLNAVYYPLFLILAPVMFILPVYQQVLVNIISFGLYFTLVVSFKEQSLWSHDLFEGFTALIFSIITILLMTQFRVQGENLKDQYYHLSRQDGLTGLLNKATGTMLAEDYVENEIIKEQFALIVLDIDDFKHINDNYGHEKGDDILKKIGQLFVRAFRKQDIVCRFGGDEFMVVMKAITDQDVEVKLKELEASIYEIDETVEFTCSMGACIEKCGKDSLTNILKEADDLMYQAKKQGKNQHILKK